MTRLEMVETLRVKAGVTYDEAREALEKNNWDMLDAMLHLKESGDKTADYARPEENNTRYEPVGSKDTRVREFTGNVGEKASKVVKFILAIIRKGEEIGVEVLFRDKVIGTVSVTVLILMMLISWFVPVLLFVLLFACGFRFRFSTNTFTGKVINNFGSKIKDEIENEDKSETEKEYEYEYVSSKRYKD